MPLDVTNRIFGGSYNSRLNTEVRIKKGLTYGPIRPLLLRIVTPAPSRWRPTRAPKPPWTQQAGGGSDGGDVARRNFAEGIGFRARLSRGRVSHPIGNRGAGCRSRAHCCGLRFARRLQSALPGRIRAISLEQVQAMAREYFTTRDLDIVLAGNVSAFRDALKKAIRRRGNHGDSFWRSRRALPRSAQAQAGRFRCCRPRPSRIPEQGKQILQAAAQAAGGDALQSVATLGFSENGILHNPRGDRQLGVTWQVSYPDAFVWRSKPRGPR